MLEPSQRMTCYNQYSHIDLLLQKIYWVVHCSIRCHYDKCVWNGVSGRMEEQHSGWAAERGGTGDILVDRCEIEFQGIEEHSIAGWRSQWVRFIKKGIYTQTSARWCLGSEQQKNVQPEEWLIFWIWQPQRSSMVSAASGGHFWYSLSIALDCWSWRVLGLDSTAAWNHTNVPDPSTPYDFKNVLGPGHSLTPSWY